MIITPVEIKRLNKSTLVVRWNDGNSKELSALNLRQNCPCAGCREQRGDTSHAAPLTSAKPSMLKVVQSSTDEETSIERVWAIGNYAIGIAWGDGHDTGIYPYQLLQSL